MSDAVRREFDDGRGSIHDDASAPGMGERAGLVARRSRNAWYTDGVYAYGAAGRSPETARASPADGFLPPVDSGARAVGARSSWAKFVSSCKARAAKSHS